MNENTLKMYYVTADEYTHRGGSRELKAVVLAADKESAKEKFQAHFSRYILTMIQPVGFNVFEIESGILGLYS